MKKHAIIITATVTAAASAATVSPQFHLSDLDVLKSEKAITINMTLDPAGYKLKSTDMVTLTPAIVAGGDTVRLTPVSLAGKRAWYYEMRNRTEASAGLLRAGKGDPVKYSASVPYESWMERSDVVMLADTVSECRCDDSRRGAVPFISCDWAPRSFKADFRYEVPSDTAEKIYDLSGRANIIFKVNRTDIDWSYASNHVELDSILRTVNAVRDNRDATVREIHLTGYASPEGPYANNVRLAKGRTEVVKNYVMNNASFPASVYHTSSVPEDWGGLREWLVNSNISRRDEMIAFIDDPAVPLPEKNDIFRSRFPGEYPFLLENVYPSLRHTDYRITYNVRKYYDVEEIREVMRTNPKNLSVNELFLLANSCEPGSPEYDRAFELAVVLHPENTTANLNAANIAMRKGRYDEAARYLEHAGDSPLAVYGRATLLALRGEYDRALPLFEKARAAGISEASEGIEEIKRLQAYKGSVTVL